MLTCLPAPVAVPVVEGDGDEAVADRTGAGGATHPTLFQYRCHFTISQTLELKKKRSVSLTVTPLVLQIVFEESRVVAI